MVVSPAGRHESIRAIPLLRPFGEIARLPPVLWMVEKLYLVFLRFRPRIQALFLRQAG
jgi:hypothetical protein